VRPGCRLAARRRRSWGRWAGATTPPPTHTATQVLHIDRNSYYGGASASLTLDQLYKRYRGPDASPPAHLGASRDYNIDLAPKFIMAHGKLVRVLVYTDVTKYLQLKAVDGSYVLNQGAVHKVPATDMEALKSQLFGTFGFFEKRRVRNFLQYVQAHDQGNPATWQGMDLAQVPMAQVRGARRRRPAPRPRRRDAPPPRAPAPEPPAPAPPVRTRSCTPTSAWTSRRWTSSGTPSLSTGMTSTSAPPPCPRSTASNCTMTA